MLIVSNMELPNTWTAASGESGESVAARSTAEFLRYRHSPDVVWVVNCNPRLGLGLATVSALAPFVSKPLVCVDIVLRRPKSVAGNLALPLKRFLLGRVDHYIHYFTDLRGYDEIYGIGPARSSFIPFKVNLKYRYKLEPKYDGDYVLCFGRSMRDFDTFFAAIEQLPYPGAIAQPDVAQLRAHGARFTRPLDQLPANVSILDDDGSDQGQMQILGGAKIVVLPVVKESLLSSISVSLNAMALGKCVIGSEGPGMSDIFSDKALIVPAEDPAALAQMIRRAWEDDDLRNRTATAGYKYAVSLGGEPELYQRIIDRVSSWYRHDRSSRRAANLSALVK